VSPNSVLPSPSKHSCLRLSDVSASKNNNLGLLRLIAATLVIISHSYILSTGVHSAASFSIGVFGLAIFFVLSGFLITKSWMDDPRLRRFFVKRLLRIMPGLVLAALFGAFLLGPAMTEFPLKRYFADPQTRQFAIRNSLLFPITFHLPGVFTHNPYPGVVNGSLWSLPIEFFAYLATAALGLLRVLTRTWAVACLLGAVVVAQFWGASQLGPKTGTVFFMPINQTLLLLSYFLGGVVLFMLRHKITLHRSWAVILALASFLAVGTRYAGLIVPFCLPYAMLTFAYDRTRIGTRLVALGDASYGMYIFSFPIQQLIAHLARPNISPWLMFALTIPVVYAISLASWHVVEKPALRLKRFFRAPILPAPLLKSEPALSLP